MDQWQRDGLEILCAVAWDGTWACPEYLELVARQNGKGCILEARVLAGFLLWGERLILWSAQLRDTALEGFLRVEDLLRELGQGRGKNMIFIGPLQSCPPNSRKCVKAGVCQFDEGAGHMVPVKVNYTNGKEQFIRLDTRQRIKVITRSDQSGRGLSPDVIVVDEAMFFTDGEQEALAFAQSARPNPQMIYTSSPPKDGDSGEVLFRLRDRAEAMLAADGDGLGDDPDNDPDDDLDVADEVPAGDVDDLVGDGDDEFDDLDGPDALGARIWGIEGDLDNLEAINLRSQANVAAANPAYGIRVHRRTVLRELNKMTARGFARERLCIWPRPRLVAGGRIDPERWEDLQDSGSVRDKAAGCSLGVEISPELDYAAILLYGTRLDGKGHVELSDRQAGITWLAGRLAELRRELDPITIGMTQTTYAVIKNDLKRLGMVRPEDRAHDESDSDTRPRRGDLLVLNGPDSAAACSQMIIAVGEMSFRVKPHAKHPEILDSAALGAKTRRSGDALVWVRVDKVEEIEISAVGAMSSARFAHLARVDALAVKKPPPASPLIDSDGDQSDVDVDLMNLSF